eukprot:EG_transcript_41339
MDNYKFISDYSEGNPKGAARQKAWRLQARPAALHYCLSEYMTPSNYYQAVLRAAEASPMKLQEKSSGARTLALVLQFKGMDPQGLFNPVDPMALLTLGNLAEELRTPRTHKRRRTSSSSAAATPTPATQPTPPQLA